MKLVVCDVCGKQYNNYEDVIEMVIPASFLDEQGDGIAIDVCGWSCVSDVVESAQRAVDQTPDAPEEPDSQPERVAVPVVPTIDPNMDEETLARFTQQATGVVRRR